MRDPWKTATYGSNALDWSVQHLDWHDSALCREVGPSLFYAEKGEEYITRMARKVCNGDDVTPPCPVKSQCLAWALQVGDNHAVLGGMTPRSRQRLLAERRREGQRSA